MPEENPTRSVVVLDSYPSYPELQARFEWNEWDGRYKQRRRALFAYRGVNYEVNITDPKFSEQYRAQFPA